MLQLQSQNALIAKISNVLSSENLACIIGAPVGFTGLVPRTAILGKFWSDLGDPSCQYNLLIVTEHIPGEDEYQICINTRLHILFRENIICITFRLDGTSEDGAELPPFISIVRCPGRPVILGMETLQGQGYRTISGLAHQNRTIASASDFRVDWAKSPEIPQKEGVLGSEIAARNRKSLATFHRTLKSQCSKTQGRQIIFEGGHELFGHHLFAWKTPTPPGGLRTWKVNLCALFSCLTITMCHENITPLIRKTSNKLGNSNKRSFDQSRGPRQEKFHAYIQYKCSEWFSKIDLKKLRSGNGHQT